MGVVVEVWSNVQCAPEAAPLVQVADWLEVTYGESLAGDVGCTLVLPAHSDAVALCSVRSVIRVEDDGQVFEFRILRLDDSLTEPVVTVTCAPVLQDVGRAPIVQYTSGLPTFTQAATTLTPTQWVDNYVLPALTAQGITWVARGTVTPTGAVTLEWTEQTPLGLLRALVQNTAYEVYLRRNGSTDYRIDLATIDRSGAVNADALVGRNVRVLRRTIDGDLQTTAVIPQGITPSGGTRVSGIERTALATQAEPSSATVKIIDPVASDNPITADDFLNGLSAQVEQMVMPLGPFDRTAGYSGYVTGGVPDRPGYLNGTGINAQYDVVRNTVNGYCYAWYSYTDRAVLVKFHASTGAVAATYQHPATTYGMYWSMSGFSPTGTAGYLLFTSAHSSDPDSDKVYIFDCNAGAFTGHQVNAGTNRWILSTGHSATWVANGRNKWYLVLSQYTTAPALVGYKMVSITTAGVATVGGAFTQPANGMAYYATGDKLYANSGTGSTDWKEYDCATDLVTATAVPAIGLCRGAWWDGNSSRIWVPVAGTATTKLYNPATNTVTDTLTHTGWYWPGGGSWAECNGVPYNAHVSGTDIYLPAASGTTGAGDAKALLRFSLSGKTYTSAQPVIRAGTSSCMNWGMWYDSTLGGVWVVEIGPVAYFVKLGDADYQQTRSLPITDSVADDGTGVSTMTVADWRQLVKYTPLYGTARRFLLEQANGNALYAVPDLAAIGAYGRLEAFLDGSPYGYRGEDNLIRAESNFATWETVSGVAQHRGWLHPNLLLQGASSPGWLSDQLALAQYGTGTAATYLVTCAATVTGQRTVTLKSLGAGKVIERHTLMSFNVYAVVLETVTADGSGNATVTLSAAVNATLNSTYTAYPLVLTTAAAAAAYGSAYGIVLGSKTSYNGNNHQYISVPVYIPTNGPSTNVVLKVWGCVPGWNGPSQNLNTLTIRYGDYPNHQTAGASPGSQVVSTVAADFALSLSFTVTTPKVYWVSVAFTGYLAVVQAVGVYLTPDTGIGYYPISAANQLWQYGLRVVGEQAEPPSAFECEVLEDDAAAPFALGGRVNLRNAVSGYTATPRVVSVSRRLRRRDTAVVATPLIALDNRRQSLVENLVRRGSV